MPFQYAGINLKQDRKFVLRLVRQAPEVLKYLEPKYQDREIALAALQGNINMKKYIRNDIVDDLEFFLLTKDNSSKDHNLSKDHNSKLLSWLNDNSNKGALLSIHRSQKKEF